MKNHTTLPILDWLKGRDNAQRLTRIFKQSKETVTKDVPNYVVVRGNSGESSKQIQVWS
ncbi:MAG TPA: hypothetical protein VNM69_01345 [Bacillus sp. (in: firmicutes)]|uniref:hypothetical protein n=1 Tax=Bacillus litorisediminis TaxID=2922713 RepID=UPI001FADEBE8|nr:hypothetical protein [Bacillus litorisediminis]HWO74542.1 hypothetical protein [Bacillus sp. (in: firmicutes)]